MPKAKSLIELAMLFSLGVSAGAQSASIVDQTANGSSCSNIVALSGARVDCSNLTSAQKNLLKKIPELLKNILDNQGDFKAIAAKLDELSESLSRLNQAAEASAGSITQSNSGGINVLQGTTGPNSPIINSPVTVNPAPPQRTLGDKRTQLVEALKSFGSYEIAITPAHGSAEAIRFAAEIESAFREAGWSIVPTQKLAFLVKDGIGLGIVTKDLPGTEIKWQDLTPGQAAVGKAFAAVGLDIKASGQANGASGPTEIYVGLQ